ncbi:hypothetical protein [Rhizobium leguminosarum]|uniref:hypothetical protein n=1 Tax=Rhizobium leguminosarum TaxID=384 RepID=UPI00103FB8DC|nr:hypothetical protein [Rhizobium leguminosarum]TBY41609.1 hypothetical protein E0H54_30950 [Rhizobium leguminosarum bv. viciae]
MPARFQEIKDWTPGYMNVAPAHLDMMVKCTACGLEREFSKEHLPRSLRQALVKDIEKRLSCSSCGAKAGKLKFGYWLREE